jgi:hypothetical protein
VLERGAVAEPGRHEDREALGAFDALTSTTADRERDRVAT